MRKSCDRSQRTKALTGQRTPNKQRHSKVLLDHPRKLFEVVHEAMMFKVTGFIIGSAENGRRMDSCH